MPKRLSHKRSHALPKVRANGPTQDILHLLKVFKVSLQRSFDHDAFGTAKAAAYSSIITFFPALLVLGSILPISRRLDRYVPAISKALDQILPIGMIELSGGRPFNEQDPRPPSTEIHP